MSPFFFLLSDLSTKKLKLANYGVKEIGEHLNQESNDFKATFRRNDNICKNIRQTPASLKLLTRMMQFLPIIYWQEFIGKNRPIIANKLLPINSCNRQEIIGNNVTVIADVEYCQ